MTSSIELLTTYAATATAPRHETERRIMAETGLHVAWHSDTDLDHQRLMLDLLPAAAACDHARLAAAFDDHAGRKKFLGNGFRTYRVVQSVLMAPLEDALLVSEAAPMRAALAALEGWWRANRTDPAAAACYARALTIKAHASLLDRVPEPDMPDHDPASLVHRARTVLAHAAPAGRRHWLWQQADYALTFVAWTLDLESQDALQPSFDALQIMDPFEFGIYDDRAVHLLPQWAGGGDIEVFARAAVDRTAAEFGDLLYTRIYDTVLGFEDPETTRIDVDRFLRGFADWMARFPSQPLANRYAAHAHAFGRGDIVADLFGTTLREIHPSQWFDLAQPLEAWHAAASSAVRRA